MKNIWKLAVNVLIDCIPFGKFSPSRIEMCTLTKLSSVCFKVFSCVWSLKVWRKWCGSRVNKMYIDIYLNIDFQRCTLKCIDCHHTSSPLSCEIGNSGAELLERCGKTYHSFPMKWKIEASHNNCCGKPQKRQMQCGKFSA